jgi:hypothetical protein
MTSWFSRPYISMAVCRRELHAIAASYNGAHSAWKCSKLQHLDRGDNFRRCCLHTNLSQSTLGSVTVSRLCLTKAGLCGESTIKSSNRQKTYPLQLCLELGGRRALANGLSRTTGAFARLLRHRNDHVWPHILLLFAPLALPANAHATGGSLLSLDTLIFLHRHPLIFQLVGVDKLAPQHQLQLQVCMLLGRSLTLCGTHVAVAPSA